MGRDLLLVAALPPKATKDIFFPTSTVTTYKKTSADSVELSKYWIWESEEKRRISEVGNSPSKLSLNPIQGLFRTAHRWGWVKRSPLSKICHTYPTLMKLGTLIPYLKRIQKVHKSRGTPLEFCWHQFFSQKIISANTGTDCILMHKF